MNKTAGFFIILLICQHSFASSSQYINPGFKIGYQFFNNHGFTFGPELSVTSINENYFYYGPVLGISICPKTHSIIPYAEMEAGLKFVGGSIGVQWDKGIQGRVRFFAGSVGFISGLIMFPDFSTEFAAIIKAPLLIRGTGIQTFNYSIRWM